MIVAFDTSTFVAYGTGSEGHDVELLDRALEDGTAMIPPMVLTELLSDPKLPESVSRFLHQLPRLDILPGFWERVGEARSAIFGKRRKGSQLRARLADAMIAQCCIDNHVPLITRDKDFCHFEKHLALELL